MPQLYMIIPVGLEGNRPIDPGFGVGGGGHPEQPIYHPGHPDHGRPARPDQGLPGGRPPHVGGGPAYPGRPVDPDWGVDVEHPDQSLPEGGEPVEPGQLPEPPVPPDLQSKIVAGLYVPGHGWTWKSYPMPEEHPDQGLPGQPQPEPKSRRGHPRSA